nr:reverse transcriptase domain-containing protein [Tanacetum cinerariifolium]
MSTRSSARNLLPPLDNPELTIRRRSHAYPTLLNDFEMATEGNGDPPVPDLRTMKELCQPSLNGGTFMKRRLDKCYDLIKNMTAHHNDWDTSAQRSKSSSSITSSFDPKIAKLKAEMAEINKNLMRVLQVNQQVKSVTPSCKTCDGPHSYNDCLATVGQTHNAYAAEAYQVVTTTEFTNYMKANDAILKNMQTNRTSLTNFNLELKNMFGQFMKMNTASSSGSGTLPSNTITNPKEDLKGITTRSENTYQGPTFRTTSSSLPKVVERKTEVTKDSVHPTNNRSTKDIQPLVVQTLIPNSEPIIAPVTEPVVAPVSASKPNQKPSNQMDECLALADLGASINLMPLLVWNKLSLPELSPTYMTLELADRFISGPVGVAEDVFVKVGTFHFLADFVVVDFDADPRVPLILGRSFLKTRRALIDVFEGELTLPQTELTSLIWLVRSILKKFSVSLIDFLLEEVDAFLALEQDPTSSEVDHSYFNTEWDILLIEAFLNDDPSLPPPTQGNYLPQGINLKFCTHKILVKDDFEPAVQHQRRVNLKIHDVIKKEVLNLLNARLIYPISDSPWVSLVHCVPKKGGFTVVENEENKLIPTRLVTRWRVCIDFHKLNEATCKDYFPLPFMDQMLKRLARNEYYCFLDGFSGYFQIPIDLKDQEKTTITCPYGTFAYRHMSFGLCNAAGGVFTARKPLKFSTLATIDPPEDIMAITTLPKRCLTLDFIGPQSIVMPTTRSNLVTLVSGMDFMGPFPSSRGNKYILVAVDYLSKWVEAKALPTNDARVVCKFLKSLFARFGTPCAIISDRHTYFCNDQFTKVMLKYGVTHRSYRVSSPKKWPGGSIKPWFKRILERTVGENCASWSDKLDDAL